MSTAVNPVGRPAANPTESKVQKLARVGAPRVNKALDALDKVIDLGPLVQAAIKENPQIDQNALIKSVTDKLVEKLQMLQKYFLSGEKRKSEFEFTGL